MAYSRNDLHGLKCLQADLWATEILAMRPGKARHDLTLRWLRLWQEVEREAPEIWGHGPAHTVFEPDPKTVLPITRAELQQRMRQRRGEEARND